MGELATGKPMFPGDSEIDEIFKIFQLLGTPKEDVWEDVQSLPDWNTRFPHWKRQDLRRNYAALGGAGIDLLEQRRVSGRARVCMVHVESPSLSPSAQRTPHSARHRVLRSSRGSCIVSYRRASESPGATRG